jgi:hypothetical protein
MVLKKFYQYLKDNNFIATVLIVVSCSITYALRENIEFKSQMVTFVNLILLGIFSILCFNSSRKHYIQWSYILCNLSVLFVFNKLYDETVFFEVFRFKLSTFIIVLGMIVSVIVLYPFFKKIVKWISCVLDIWTTNKINKREKYRKKEDKQIKYVKNDLSNIKSDKQKELIEAEVIKNVDETKSVDKTKDNVNHRLGNLTHYLLYTSIFCGLLFITVVMILVATKQDSSIIEKITSKNLLTVIISIVMTLVFLVFIAGIIISLFIKWMQIISQIITKQKKGDFYFVYALCLFLISQYIFDNYSYTVDDFVDLLLSGKFITFPLILSILIPVFLIFTENIIQLTKENGEIKNILKKYAKKTLDIAEGIVDSLFVFIQFVTCDFITTIIEFTKEDE